VSDYVRRAVEAGLVRSTGPGTPPP